MFDIILFKSCLIMPKSKEIFIGLPNLISKNPLIELNNYYFNGIKKDINFKKKQSEANIDFLKNFTNLIIRLEKLLYEMAKESPVNEKQDQALAKLIDSLNPNKNQSLEAIETALNDFKEQFSIKNSCSETLISIAATIVGLISGILAGVAGAIIGFGYGLYNLNLFHMFSCSFIFATHGFTNAQELVLGKPRALVKSIETINPHLFWKSRVAEILTRSYENLVGEDKSKFYTELLLLTDTQTINILSRYSPVSLTALKTDIDKKINTMSCQEDQKYYQSINNKIEKVEQHREKTKQDLQTIYTSSFQSY